MLKEKRDDPKDKWLDRWFLDVLVGQQSMENKKKEIGGREAFEGTRWQVAA